MGEGVSGCDNAQRGSGRMAGGSYRGYMYGTGTVAVEGCVVRYPASAYTCLTRRLSCIWYIRSSICANVLADSRIYRMLAQSCEDGGRWEAIRAVQSPQAARGPVSGTTCV